MNQQVSCPHCGKQFRKGSGLAYHLGWAHRPAGTGSPHTIKSSHPPDGEDKDKNFLEEFFQQLPSAKEQAKLLGQIQEQLGRLQDHEHEAVEDCATCYEMLHEIGQRGMLAGARAVFSIPGIPEANAYYNWATTRKARSNDLAIVTNWAKVPGIQALLDNYAEEDDIIQYLQSPADSPPWVRDNEEILRLLEASVDDPK